MALENLDEKTRDELAALALKLAGGKKRKEFLKLTKDEFPATNIPELQMEEELEKRVDERVKPIQEALTAIQQQRATDDWKASRSTAMTEFGLSEEDMGKVDKMITDKQLPADYKWAGQLYRAQAEASAPTNFGVSGHGPVDMPNDEALMKNPDRWALTQAHTLVDDLRRRAGGKF